MILARKRDNDLCFWEAANEKTVVNPWSKESRFSRLKSVSCRFLVAVQRAAQFHES